jgi:formate hydrogenlyase subunit 6/NADH:ubiquinone oxidoreductase subunit I
VEAYLCWTYNTRESIEFALDAVKMIFANLEVVYADGNNIAARQAMLLASYKAGFAFTRAGVGNIHAIAHTLGGLYNVPHGLANAIILPKVLEDYGKKVHKKLAVLAEVAGLVGGGRTSVAKARIFIDAIYAMNERFGIPKGFDYIKNKDIPQMVKWAMKESNPLYPVPVIYNKKRFTRVIESLRLSEEKTAYHISEACIGCTVCAKICPVFAINGKKSKRHIVNEKRCVGCGVCGRVCPSGAIIDNTGSICTRVNRDEWKKPIINTDICTACSICVNDCTQEALRISLPKFRGDIKVFAELAQPQKCTGCAICESHCPMKAISMEVVK